MPTKTILVVSVPASFCVYVCHGLTLVPGSPPVWTQKVLSQKICQLSSVALKLKSVFLSRIVFPRPRDLRLLLCSRLLLLGIKFPLLSWHHGYFQPYVVSRFTGEVSFSQKPHFALGPTYLHSVFLHADRLLFITYFITDYLYSFLFCSGWTDLQGQFILSLSKRLAFRAYQLPRKWQLLLLAHLENCIHPQCCKLLYCTYPIAVQWY